MQPGDGGGEVRGPGPLLCEAQPQAAAAAGEPARDGEQARPESFGFPAASGAGQGERLGPGQQLAGPRDDLARRLVLREPLQRQVPQPGVLGVADAVLAAGPAAEPQLQAGELAAFGVGGQGGEPVPVDVGEPQLRPGVRAFLADDDPHPGRPATHVQQAGDVRHPRPVADLAAAVIGCRPRLHRDFADRVLDGVRDGHADGVMQPPGPGGQPGEELVRRDHGSHRAG